MEKAFNHEIRGKSPDIFIDGPVETEKNWPRLRGMVIENYKEHGVEKKLIEQFDIHNKQVEEFVADCSGKEGFTEKQREIAILAAILHDITKGYGDFLEHGEEGGRLAEEMLLKIGASPELAWSVRLAIERHMGPAGYPTEKAKAAYGQDFEYSKYATEVGQLIYECDILTQLTTEGFAKILLLRKLDKNDLAEDEKTAEEKGITIEKARFLSVLKSAQESFKQIKLESVKEKAADYWKEIEEKYKQYL